MGSKTSIEWTDATWSPIRYRVKSNAAQIANAKGYASLVSIAEKMAGRVGQHCEHISPGCEHCYAGTNNHRCLPGNGTGLPYDRRSRDLVDPFIDEKMLLQPLKWKPAYDEIRDPDGVLLDMLQRPRRIFVENQSDLFGEWVTDAMIDRVFALMALCPQHIFQVLTKRPDRMLKYMTGHFRTYSPGPREMAFTYVKKMRGYDPEHPKWVRMAANAFNVIPLPNVWLGVSAENQAAADERIPLLLQTPAAVRFISAEPLLGPVRFDRMHEAECGGDFEDCAECGSSSMVVDAFTAHAYCAGEGCTAPGEALALGRIDWVICGGESGPGARPMHPNWARSLRDQCAAAGVPFFMKQWGAWTPKVMQHIHSQEKAGQLIAMTTICSSPKSEEGKVSHWAYPSEVGEGNWGLVERMEKAGKKAAVALLDGVEYKQFPEAR